MTRVTLAATCLAIVSGSAVAAQKTYTFADANGAPSCDGIALTQTGGLETGTTFTLHCGGKPIAGLGLKGKFPGYAHPVWSFIYSDKLKDNVAIILDEKALVWGLYVQNPDQGQPLTEVNSGLLLKGKVGSGAAASILPAME